MRILMVTSEFPPMCGGIGWYVYYLCREMASYGHEITIMQRAPDIPEHYDSFSVQPLRVGRVPLLNAYRVVGKVRNFLKKNAYDIAIVHSTPLGAWIKDVPTLLVVHCCIAECEKIIYKGAHDFKSLLHRTFGFIYREVERRSVLGADKVAVVSKAMKRETLNHYSVNAHYVGNGVDTKIFFPMADPQARGVLLPSMFRSGKGIREAIKVIENLRIRGCDIPFRFIGAGPMKKWLEKRISCLRLTGVELLPPVDHSRLKELYHMSSIVFLPSYYEGLPTVALEAMASGLPVVATDAGGTSEAVLNGETGYVHHVTDVEGMAESILSLERDGDLRNRMGRKGLDRIKAAYTWDIIGDNYQAVFEAIT